MKTLSKSRTVNRRATFKSRLDIRTSSKELSVLLKSVKTNKKLNGTCFITRLLLHYLLFYLWIDNKSLLEWFGFSHSLKSYINIISYYLTFVNAFNNLFPSGWVILPTLSGLVYNSVDFNFSFGLNDNFFFLCVIY